MKYSKEDLPKIIILSLVLLAVLVVAVVRYTRGAAQLRARMAGHAAEHANAADSTAQATSPSPEIPAASRALAALLTPVEPPTRDPFDPLIPPRSAQNRQAQTVTPPKEPGAAPPSLPPLVGTGSAGGGSDGNSLHLKGVIAGPPSIALLRRGEQRYIVRQGDYIEGTLRVERITRDTVILRSGGTSYELDLRD